MRRATDVTHKSLTDFILESACQAAVEALLDQRLFMVTHKQYKALLDLLDSSTPKNPGLQDLFSKPPPWDQA